MKVLTGFIFCLAAVLLQIGAGSLPTGEVCLACPTIPTPTHCDCCGDDADTDAPTSCCCKHEQPSSGCERCVMVRLPDRNATNSVRTTFTPPITWPLADLPSVPIAPTLPLPPQAAPLPRITGSPPDLAAIRTTRLTI